MLRRSVFADRLCAFPEIALGDDAIYQHRGGWRDLFRARSSSIDRLVFEVGCFDAAYLCRLAAKHPLIGFIGLDWKCKAIYDGAVRITELNLPNVILLRGRAQDLPRIVADQEIDEMLVLHPEPCDRPAERANRLLADPFFINAHRALSSNSSRLSIKTDHAGYYQYLLAIFSLPEPAWRHRRDLVPTEELLPPSRIARERFSPIFHSADFWNDPVVRAHVQGRCFEGETTAYEQRFVKKRQPIYYLDLQKINLPAAG